MVGVCVVVHGWQDVCLHSINKLKLASVGIGLGYCVKGSWLSHREASW